MDNKNNTMDMPSDSEDDLNPSAKSRYATLEKERSAYLERARDMSSLTLPYIFPREGDSSSILPQPWQSYAGRGVSNLTAKIVHTILPPNEPSFKYSLDKGEAELAGLEADQIAEMETELTKIANRVGKSIESSNIRAVLTEAIKQLMVGGNSLIYAKDERINRVYNLGSYVVVRDGTGDVQECIVHQELMQTDFKGEALEWVNAHLKEIVEDPIERRTHKFDVYTHILLKEGKHHWHQEAFSKIIPGTKSRANLNETPWLALRWTAESGASYGRSLVEENQGDIETYERYVEAMREWAGSAARVVFLNDPAGVTDITELNEAESGEWIEGREGDLTAFSSANVANFSTVATGIQELKTDIAKVFLMNTSIQRQGERVTAEEIRYMARELEANYGGIYSSLAHELQLPLIKRRIAILTREKKIPNFDQTVATPIITTGLEALGRGHDADKLDALLSDLGQLFGPDKIAQYVNLQQWLQRKAASLSVDIAGVVFTEEEVKENMEREQLNQAAQSAVPNLASGAVTAATQQAAA